MGNLNVLQWDGAPGHYEVYYLSATDPATGIGLWIRYTMLRAAPISAATARCGSWPWIRAGDVAVGAQGRVPDRPSWLRRGRPVPAHGRRRELTDRGMAGGFEDVAAGSFAGSRRRPLEHVAPAAAPRARRQDRAGSAARRPRGRRARWRSAGASSSWTARAAARRTCGAPSTPRAGRGRTANDFAGRRGPRPGDASTASRVRAAAGPRDRAEHAGRRAASWTRTSRRRARWRVVRAPQPLRR